MTEPGSRKSNGNGGYQILTLCTTSSSSPLTGNAEPSSPTSPMSKLARSETDAFEDQEDDEVKLRKKTVEYLEDEEQDLKTRLDLWRSRVAILTEKLEEVNTQKEAEEEDLKVLLNPVVPKQWPGPAHYRFVDESKFIYLSSLVILANLILMGFEMKDPGLAENMKVVDNLFLLFYCIELWLKASLMHWGLLCGPCGEVWWNWLDMVIVFSGVIDQWVVPIIEASVGGPEQEGKGGVGGGRALRLLRLLRLARLARALKILRVLLMSDFSWTEGARFQSFILGVIFFNSILMGFEADLPDFPLWAIIEQVLLVIYTFELFVRMKRAGWRFFANEDYFWNYMDFLIVIGGIVDQWMLPCMVIVEELYTGKQVEKVRLGEGVVLLRMARLLRILRLVRLIKNIPPLFNLIMGVLASVGGMMWVIVLAAVLLYAFAILAVRLIGHGLVFGHDPPEDVSEAQETFPSVPESMFVLFRVMNGDATPLFPLFAVMPMTKLIFALFMVTCGWAILGVLSAVICDKMIQANEMFLMDKMLERTQAEEKAAIEKLTRIFEDIDVDKSGDISEREFSMILANDHLAEELCEAAGLGKFDLVDLFDLLSDPNDSDGGHRTISYRNFIVNLSTESNPPTKRTCSRIQKQIRDLAASQHEMCECLLWTKARVWEMSKQQSEDGNVPQPPEDPKGYFSWEHKPLILGQEWRDDQSETLDAFLAMDRPKDKRRVSALY